MTHFTWCLFNHLALSLLHTPGFLFVACSHAVSALYNNDLFLSTYFLPTPPSRPHPTPPLSPSRLTSLVYRRIHDPPPSLSLLFFPLALSRFVLFSYLLQQSMRSNIDRSTLQT